jgi:hypothetical protein
MAKLKYRRYFEKMIDNNKVLFDSFQKLHDDYALDSDRFQEKFNKEGEKILEVIREWENKLCMQSEKGGYSRFTPKLAEKFQDEIKKHFPKIDHVGLKVENPSKISNIFKIKKINL